MMERRFALTLTALLVFVSSAFSYYAGAAGLLPQLNQLVSPGAPIPKDGTPSAAQGIDLRLLQHVQRLIDEQFIDPVDAQKLTEGALKGMVEATGDRYSSYYNPEEYKRFLEHFESSFSGIGVRVELSAKTGLITVVSPIKGSPGEKAGLRTGDSIIQVDETDIRGLQLEQAVQLIRGPDGSQVRLQVQREGLAEPLEFVVTRAIIETPSLESRMIEPGIGYIHVMEFNKQIAARTNKAITDLKAQGMTRLILDLRMNPGGLLDEAIDFSSIFVAGNQPVVHIVQKGGEKRSYGSTGKAQWSMPLVVLVDEGSASASEIAAGAIKDYQLGTLIGAKTFGKGSVQSFHGVPGGGGIKLTTSQYLTAGGHSIHQKGIEPDLLVENPTKVLPGSPGDKQLEEAIRYIKNMTR